MILILIVRNENDQVVYDCTQGSTYGIFHELVWREPHLIPCIQKQKTHSSLNSHLKHKHPPVL